MWPTGLALLSLSSMIVLHATATALIPGEHFFHGEHCISRYNQPVCPIGGACLRGDNCAFWGTGVYHWHSEPYYDYQNFLEVDGDGDRYHVKAHRYTLPGVPACKSTDLPAYWFYGQWRAGPNATCAYHRISRPAMRDCLRTRKVLFVGDSLVRQLLIRTIYYLRGFEDVIEHYYHAHSTYSYYESKFDNATAFDSWRPLMAPDFDDADAGPLRDGEAFRLNFLWGLMDEAWIVAQVARHAPDAVVLGGFCLTRDGDLKNYVEDIVKLGQAGAKPSRVYIMPIAEGVWSANDATAYGQRIRDKADRWRGEYPLVDVQVLPVDRMSMASCPYQKNEVERYPTHYMCTYFPQWQFDGGELEGFKAPASRDCRDLFNYELMTMMLNSMC